MENDAFAEYAADEQPDVDAIDQLCTRRTLEESCGMLPPAQVQIIVPRVVHGLPVQRVAAMRGPHARQRSQHAAPRPQRLRAT